MRYLYQIQPYLDNTNIQISELEKSEFAFMRKQSRIIIDCCTVFYIYCYGVVGMIFYTDQDHILQSWFYLCLTIEGPCINIYFYTHSIKFRIAVIS